MKLLQIILKFNWYYNPLSIIGRDDLCNYAEGVKYTTDPKIGSGFFNWVVPEDAIIINNLDTSMYVNFGKEAGYIYLQSVYCEDKFFFFFYVSLDGPHPDLGNDTSFCSDFSLTLSPGTNYAEYFWQDGSIEPSLEATKPGTYWIRVMDEISCEGSDSIIISLIEIPEIDLGGDSILMTDDSYLLNAGPGFDNYIWNDYSEGQVLLAYGPGKYWVTGYLAQCTASDTVWLYKEECQIKITNIVTPNGDGISDEIFVVSNPIVSHFELMVYDLKGILIY